jgi:hypothetical protein
MAKFKSGYEVAGNQTVVNDVAVEPTICPVQSAQYICPLSLGSELLLSGKYRYLCSRTTGMERCGKVGAVTY